jgi:hypothetical protein
MTPVSIVAASSKPIGFQPHRLSLILAAFAHLALPLLSGQRRENITQATARLLMAITPALIIR